MPIHHTTSGALISGSATIGATSVPHQFLDRALKLHEGLKALAQLGERQAHASIFLASWCLELALKGHLVAMGKGKKELRPIQHNLAALWIEAANLGLGIPNSPPRWCSILSKTHDDPYHQRYPTDAVAFLAPNVQTVVAELATLLNVLEHSLQ